MNPFAELQSETLEKDEANKKDYGEVKSIRRRQLRLYLQSLFQDKSKLKMEMSPKRCNYLLNLKPQHPGDGK